MTDRIRNAWAVLTGKATVCTHPTGWRTNSTYTLWFGDSPYIVSGGSDNITTPFRKTTI